MPLYPYECICGHKEERLVPSNSPKQLKCPKCGKKTLKRMLGTPVGKLYRPDRDKVLDTMKFKRTTYGANGEKLNVNERKVYN